MLHDTTEERTIPLRPRAVIMDETWGWDLSDWPEVECIKALYWYDWNEATYLCEVTPSRALYWVDTWPEFKKDLPDTDDMEALKDEIRDEVVSQDYETRYDRVTYMHCREVDALPGHLYEVDERPFSEMSYEAQVDDWQEYFSGNGSEAVNS